MTIKIIAAKTQEEKSNLAALCLRNRLFVSGWELSHYLRRIKTENNTKYEIVVAEIDAELVGVAIKTQADCFQCFVRKKMRRKKIGTTLISNLKQVTKKQNFTWDYGIEGSGIFWEKQSN